MVNTHVAHDCVVGNNVIITNNALLGGHVVVEDRAFVSGAVAVHQFCRVGTMAMVGGQAHITKDVPPFVTVDGLSSLVVGLNTIGLRRSGLSSSDIRLLKEAYRVIYRSGLAWKEILQRLEEEFGNTPAAHFHVALSMTTRGIVSERRLPPGATLKLHRDADEKSEPQTLVGDFYMHESEATEARIVALEESLMHLEHTLKQLDGVVCSIQNRIDKQSESIKHLTEVSSRLSHREPEQRTLEDDRPPHY